MSEMGGSYDPGPWRGYNHNSARAAHKKPTAGRGYGGRSRTGEKNKSIDDLVPKKLVTTCRSPIAIVTDGTGSMGDFPELMFKKLFLLDNFVKEYLDDFEFSFAMVGDHQSDKYALQVQPFVKGKRMVKTLNELVIEGNGGGNQKESYEMAAAFYAHNVEMPNAEKPILIYICDEGLYPSLSKANAMDYANVSLQKDVKTGDLFEQLKEKWSVYCVRKHYWDQVENDKMYGDNLKIHKQWEKMVGADNIAMLNDPGRVADVILGLIAHDTGKSAFFKQELNHRQTKAQVNTVMQSMVSVYAGDSDHTGKSVMLYDGGGDESESLL